MRVLFSRWTLSFVGVALLAGLVWVFGPLLEELEPPLPRLGVAGAMVLVWAVANLLLDRRRARREAALTQGVSVASREEAAALGDKLTQALALLKRARGTRGYLYEQPWYAIIGPPGAGKTTALLNAGLKFPLAAEMGQGAVAGVGGTRLCEWWFTGDAVLIDTAGRYTTQDSDAAIDRAGWDAFLDLLKRTRPRQPLNGVIVAIALSDIAQASQDERTAHARAIRRRVNELETRLGVRMPVYALFTKADLIAGFSEFFDDLDRETRAQVWGATFPLAAGEAGPGAAFPEEFRLLVARLNDRLLQRLQDERSPERRALIAGFPTQVASLEQPLTEFLQEAFGGSSLNPAPLLRGAYFASGTQEGTPIDRLTAALSRAFGLNQRRAPSLRPEQGRSYFLGRLLTEVIFGEAMLVSARPSAARRRVLVRLAGFAVILLAVLAAGGLLARSRMAGQREVDAAAASLAAYEQAADGVKLDPVADADLPGLVPLLDQARALPYGDSAGDDSWLGFGLSQDAKMRAGARAVYRHGIDNALLPRLIWRLEAQMRGNLNQPDFLYEATRIYLMLGGVGPLDRNLVREWMMLDWRGAYPGAVSAPLREALARHLDVLLASDLPQIALDDRLVAQARATFGRVPLAQRVYSLIRPSAAARALPPWNPADVLGVAGAAVFVRASGKLLSDGVPGFYTPEGFHKVLLPALAPALKDVASESWVLGQHAAFDPASPQMQALEHDVVALYETEYAQVWDAMLADLNVAPLRSLPQAAQDLYILAAQQSPMRALLASAAQELTLSALPAPEGAARTRGPLTAAAAPATTTDIARLQAVLGGAGQGEGPLPGREIDDRYKPLRDLVAGGPGAPIDQVLKPLSDLQQEMAKLAAAPVNGTLPRLPPGSDPALALRTEAQSLPQPLARWLTAMAASGTVLRAGGAQQQVVAAFNSGGGPASLCPATVNGRFPFKAGAADETSIDDFGKLFAPGGLIDGFINTQLRPYVDRTGRTWKPQPAEGVAAPVSAADLAQFQQAALIRDLFFPAGGTTPSIRFDITPVSLDAGATQVTLDLDGTPVVYAHGPSRATQITWPGPNRMQNVHLVFDPPPPNGTGVLQDTGPWALFRMLGRGKLQQAGSLDRYTLTFQLGTRQAAFEIHATTARNPFAPDILQDFHCPAVQ